MLNNEIPKRIRDSEFFGKYIFPLLESEEFSEKSPAAYRLAIYAMTVNICVTVLVFGIKFSQVVSLGVDYAPRPV